MDNQTKKEPTKREVLDAVYDAISLEDECGVCIGCLNREWNIEYGPKAYKCSKCGEESVFNAFFMYDAWV